MAVAVVGCLVTAGAATFQQRSSSRLHDERVTRNAAQVELALQAAAGSVGTLVDALRGLHHASVEVADVEQRDYVAQLWGPQGRGRSAGATGRSERFPGVQAVGLGARQGNRVVIRSATPGDMGGVADVQLPPGALDRAVLLPIPAERDRSLLVAALDAHIEPSARAPGPPGGLVLVVVDLRELLAAPLSGTELRAKARWHVAAPAVTAVDPQAPPGAAAVDWGATTDLDLAGATVRVQVEHLDDHGALERLPWQTIAAGLVITALAAGLVHSQQRWRAVMYRRIDEATATIAAQRQHYADLALRYHRQSRHDALTDLPNRRMLAERIAEVRAHDAVAGGARPLGLVLLDLDGFKHINDSLGHAAGDEVLVQVATLLRDAVEDEHLVVRLGGDEFAVLVAGPAALVEEVAALIEHALAEPLQVGERTVAVHASVGVAVSSTSSAEAGVLLRDADLAMYAAKREPGTRIRRFAPELHTDALERLSLESDLRAALDAQAIDVDYQPIVALRSSTVVAVEALARWHHPARGWVPPDVFVAVAEETGLVVELGRQVLERALHDVAREGCAVSVNVSPTQLADPHFVDEVRATLERAGVAPRALTLELTESGAVVGRGAAATLAELRALGIRIAVDDFGTGWSSLAALHALPIDVVKIDRSFIADVDRDEPTMQLAGAVIGVSQALGLGCIVEGVETPAQLAVVRDLGASLGQGYGIARPMPAPRLHEWLATQPVVRDDLLGVTLARAQLTALRSPPLPAAVEPSHVPSAAARASAARPDADRTAIASPGTAPAR